MPSLAQGRGRTQLCWQGPLPPHNLPAPQTQAHTSCCARNTSDLQVAVSLDFLSLQEH